VSPHSIDSYRLQLVLFAMSTITSSDFEFQSSSRFTNRQLQRLQFEVYRDTTCRGNDGGREVKRERERERESERRYLKGCLSHRSGVAELSTHEVFSRTTPKFQESLESGTVQTCSTIATFSLFRRIKRFMPRNAGHKLAKQTNEQTLVSSSPSDHTESCN
jgi:hypothetical protein